MAFFWQGALQEFKMTSFCLVFFHSEYIKSWQIINDYLSLYKVVFVDHFIFFKSAYEREYKDLILLYLQNLSILILIDNGGLIQEFYKAVQYIYAGLPARKTST